MEITLHADCSLPEGTDALVVACAPGDDRLATEPLLGLDRALGGHLGRLWSRKEFRGKKGQELVVSTLGRLDAAELCLLGAGDELTSAAAWHELGLSLGGRAARARWGAVALRTVGPTLETRWMEPLVRGLLDGRYRYRKHRTAKEEDPADPGFSAIHLLDLPASALTTGEGALADAAAVHEAVSWCRDLVNEPPSRCTPSFLAEAARRLANDRGLGVEVLDRAACEALGLGLFLAVAQGSAEPPALIHLWHRPPAPRGPRVALVGKGITFDSGGLSLKTSEGMKEMKSDMAGGATVLAALSLLPRLDLPLEVHALVPACENMPSDRAYKLGDVLRGLDGPSVEIVNTDAEGRLVLADGLCYARRLGATVLVDLATLTGACMVALGEHTAGLFGTDDALANVMLRAAEEAGESLYRLPLLPALDEQLKSAVADCKNSGGRWGGAITAALFLRRFVKDTPWLHLDIAGPAYRDKAGGGRPAGATGYGVATVLGFLRALAESSLPESPPGSSPVSPLVSPVDPTAGQAPSSGAEVVL